MYTHHKHHWIVSFLGALALLGLVACDKDENGNGNGVQGTMFTITIENISNAYSFLNSGVQGTPVGTDTAAPLQSGEMYEVEFYAGPEQKLSFALMFMQSNDFFYAPAEDGIALFGSDGNPVSGDITSELTLWDAGTELDQEPGLGEDQALRQADANTGAPDADDTVREAGDNFGNLPATSDVLRATLIPGEDNLFTLRIENVSTDMTLQMSDGTTASVPLSPMVFVLHREPGPLFTEGSSERAAGLEALAEDGNPDPLAATLEGMTGLATAFSPGVYAIHREGNVLFTEDQAVPGTGLEKLAEDGDPEQLATNLENHELVIESGTFDVPEGDATPGPAEPGESYEFTVEAVPGQYLSLATMLIESNDLFFATPAVGMPLFDGPNPRVGEITQEIQIWDAGTEVNQALGAGPDQGARQDDPDTGPVESGVVQVAEIPDLPPANYLIRVTITSVEVP